jgi:hypothetical protein
MLRGSFLLFAPLLLSGAPAPGFAGASACRPCHTVIFQAQAASEHARALALSSPTQPPQWAFGAGAQAITFVRRLDSDTYIEEGLSWYRESNSFAMTPGHIDTLGVRFRLFDPAAGILRCFSCHSTGPVTLSANQEIVPAELGVRCESCHGPAADHVRDPAHHKPVNPGKFSAVRLNEFCGGCHRKPSAPDDTPNLNDPWNARHQPLLLAASRCFKASQGRLTCLTCHGPHAALEAKAATYNAACARCHAAVKHARPVVAEACTTCHMPAVRAGEHLTFANHRIAIY